MILRPSNAEVWTHCPGSTRLPAVEKPPTPESLEGDLCHLLAELMGTELDSSTPVAGMHENPILQERNKTGLTVTGEHVDLSLGALRYCQSLTGIGNGQWETFMDGDVLPKGVKGTCDFMGYEEETKTLHVVDLKFGFSPVSAVDNMQLLCYSVGAHSLMGAPEISSVALHIYQPRNYIDGPVSVWNMPSEEWSEQVGMLYDAAATARGREGSTRTGPWCRYCKSRVYCRAFLTVAASALETVELSVEHAPLDPEHYGAELAYLKQAETYVVSARKAYEDLIMAEIEEGRPVPGWVIGSTRGKRRWSASIEELRAAGSFNGVNLLTEKPISITDAWKMSKLRPILKTLISKSEGTKKLVPFDQSNIKEKLTHD